MEPLRNYTERLEDFCKLKNYELVADTGDYIILKSSDGTLLHCHPYAIHLAMLDENIK